VHRRRLVLLLVVVVTALAAGCGSGPIDPPRPGEIARSEKAKSFDPSSGVLDCLRGAGIAVRPLRSGEFGVGDPASDMRIVFARTLASAELAQLRGDAEGAMVINRVLFYVGHAPDDRVQAVEGCVNAKAGNS
jgi:hypothetical protein